MGARILAAALPLMAVMATSIALANPNSGKRDRDDDRHNERSVEEARTVPSMSVTTTERGQILISSVIIVSNTGAVLGGSSGSAIRRVDEDRVDLSGLPLVGGLFGRGDDDDYDDEDGPPPRLRIGTAYYLGNVLAVDLDEPAVQPASLTPEQLRELEAGLKPAQVAIESRIADVAHAGDADLGIGYDWQNRTIEFDAFKLLNTQYSYNIPATAFLQIGSLTDPPADAETGGRSKIPVLGDIPLLGNLFTQRAGDAYLENRTLVVLIKPSIREHDYE